MFYRSDELALEDCGIYGPVEAVFHNQYYELLLLFIIYYFFVTGRGKIHGWDLDSS